MSLDPSATPPMTRRLGATGAAWHPGSGGRPPSATCYNHTSVTYSVHTARVRGTTLHAVRAVSPRSRRVRELAMWGHRLSVRASGPRSRTPVRSMLQNGLLRLQTSDSRSDPRPRRRFRLVAGGTPGRDRRPAVGAVTVRGVSAPAFVRYCRTARGNVELVAHPFDGTRHEEAVVGPTCGCRSP